MEARMSARKESGVTVGLGLGQVKGRNISVKVELLLPLKLRTTSPGDLLDFGSG